MGIWMRAVVAIATLAACIPPVPLPPTAGYGPPYRGTGEGIYVKDSRNDWDVTEGQHKLTSEQALEAAGDVEYEARRQIARDYNVRLYREGEAHRQRGTIMMGAAAAMIAAGFVLALAVAPGLQQETITPATATMPEMRSYTAGSANVVVGLGDGLIVLGGIGVLYGFFGGKSPPPYHPWRTPPVLDRPAYVRQQTEPYNDKIGAPALPDEPRHLPPMRGGRR